MGCLRLSTERDRDEDRAVAVLHAALDAGVTLLDTADAYCRDDSDTGHNERLIARALASWNGERARIVVATKGGLTRPDGRWAADGRARHLTTACEASCRALGVGRIQLYQLHAPDPRVPLSTSVRALAALERAGLIDSIGLCNVTVAQIEEARRITGIACVQNELSLWNDSGLLSGVLGYCAANGIRFLAYRPLGGPQRRRKTQVEPLLVDLAARHGATPFEIALAWLRDLAEVAVPLPGPTRVETAGSVGRIAQIALTEDDRRRLDERFPAGLLARPRPDSGSKAPQAEGEVVLIMGLPGAGKSTLAQSFVARGYTRLNRDLAGGSLRGLATALDEAVAAGSSRIVLDNTYVTRKARASVLQTARQHRIPVRCVQLATTIEDAQVNAVSRMAAKYGELLDSDRIRETARGDTAAFGPMVQFRYQRDLEPPDLSEGFTQVDIVNFERRRNPALTNRAVVVWCDGVLLRSRSGLRTPASADDVEVFAERGDVLRRFQADGWQLLGLSWQPEIAEGTLTRARADECFARMGEELGVAIEVEYCPHAAGPPVCWCRKPLPGLGVLLIQRHRLDASQCLYVGSGSQDPGFARKLGFQYREAAGFFTP
jgi:aryl-alcohol dehydrogenase-like predicted oxidoreductase/histidinol phosphatase-like enzyme/predicted kinase